MLSAGNIKPITKSRGSMQNGLSDRALDIGLAARALALAKGGSCSTAAEHGDKVAVTEVRRFAGKDVLVS